MARTRKPRRAPGDQPLRAALAQESARLVVEHGIGDVGQALRKAARRLGVDDPSRLPRPEEVEQAVRERQRLFGGGAQREALAARRHAAVEAMRFLAAFEPRLVGAVLDGTADAHSPVQLHLFSDDPDAVQRFLQDQRIPHVTGARRLRHGRGRGEPFPLHAFTADGIDFELVVLPRDGLRQAPLDASGERPMARAGRAAVEQLPGAGGDA